MLDVKQLRTQLQDMAARLAKRNFVLDQNKFLALEERRRQLQNEVEAQQQQRNQLSKEIGIAKQAGKDIEIIKAEVVAINASLDKAKVALDDLQVAMTNFLLEIPNLPHDSVPLGKSEADNQLVRSWGELPQFNFTPLDHVALGEAVGQMSFEEGAKLAGARFVVVKKQLAKLQRALAQFMLDIHIQEHHYQEHYVPTLVQEHCLYGSGQLPKFKADLFAIDNGEYYLIPTAEVPLVNLARDHIFAASDLPQRWTALSSCFRSEAGSYGKDTRGMIRLHQFEKVELVQIVKPENSYQALEEMVGHAEKILQLLQLPYRVMLLCTGDMGFSAAKTYDLEVWLPGQNAYREISSCSNCEDFQARRMQARYRDPANGKPQLVHTLNASGLPLGRTLVAIIENYQTKEGRIRIPDILLPYMNGVTEI